MIIKNSPIKIDSHNIFENDALDREKTIKSLTTLVMDITDPFVLSINGDWGIGKTTFVKLWRIYLQQQNINSIHFNAWKNDFSKEPILSILGEFNEYIDENFSDEDESSIKTKFNKVKEVSAEIIKRAVPAMVKGATAGVLDIDKGFESAIGAMTEESSKKLIENYSKEKEITEKFKEAIKKVLDELDSDRPFLVFIDELDRCRPLYAIELLENIKHMFGIEKLIFVLSLDKKQLSESIKSQYGNIDTDNYLRRFIDLEYELSNPNIDSFCDALYKKFDLKENIPNSTIKDLVKVFKLSLRQIEQIFSRLGVIFEHTFEEKYIDLILFFEVLKSYSPNLYDEYLKERDSQNLLDLVRKDMQLNMTVFKLFNLLENTDNKSISKIVNKINMEN